MAVQQIKHDAQGFLTGTPIDIGRALSVWDHIYDDVRAIRRALTEAGAAPNSRNNIRAAAAPSLVPGAGRSAIPLTGGAGGNANARGAQVIALAGQAVTAARVAQQAAQKVIAKPATRDSRGRFVGGAGARVPERPGAGGASSGSSGGGDGEESGAIRSIAARLVGAAKESGSGLEEADPTVKAFNEVARPMARGYEMLTGGSHEKKQEGWMRRIWTSLTGMRKDETTFSKAANRSLKNIESKPDAAGGEGGGGLLSGLSGLLPKIPLIGSMLSGGGAMSGMMGLGKGVLGAGKGLLKRIPLLGTLLSGVGAATDIFSAENDDSLTRREKDGKDGKAAGGFAGGVGGMLVGAKLGAAVGALGGPIGIAIGGVVGGAAGMFFGDQAGQVIGEKVGGWVSDLREADIPGKITGAWDVTTDFIKKGWDGALGKMADAWKSIKDAGGQVAQWTADKADQANGFIKDKTGIDVKGGAQRLASWAGDTATAAKDKASEIGGIAVDGIKRGAGWAAENTTVGRGVAKVVDGATAAGNWALGQTSKMFESGKGGAGTVSTGKGDFGGASYGTYQLSSKQGTLQQFLKSGQYGDQFTGLQPGTPEFNEKWKDVAKNDPSFGDAQHDFIKQTHYDPALAGLKKGGIDLSGRGAAVQDALWSSSVQFGAGNEKKGAVSIFQKALDGKDVAKMSDQDLVSAVQDYKLANNDKLFASSSDAVRAGTAKRATTEKDRLLALAGTPDAAAVSPTSRIAGIVSPAAPVVASVNAPAVSVAPNTPALAEAPAVTVPMASNDSSRPLVVAAQSKDVGQDLRDRGIAHVATGGLSG